MTSKRQYTKTLFVAKRGHNTGIVLRLIKRKSRGRPFDVIQLSIYRMPPEDNIHLNIAPEEALEIAWGLIKAVHQFMADFEPYRIFRSQGSRSPLSKGKVWWSTNTL